MAEDLKSRLAAIAAAKEKRQQDAKLGAAWGEAHEEDTLHNKAKQLEATVAGAEQGAADATDAIEQAEAMLASPEDLEPNDIEEIKRIKVEARKKIEELKKAKGKWEEIKDQIAKLNTGTRPAVDTSRTRETGTGGPKFAEQLPPSPASEVSVPQRLSKDVVEKSERAVTDYWNTINWDQPGWEGSFTQFAAAQGFEVKTGINSLYTILWRADGESDPTVYCLPHLKKANDFYNRNMFDCPSGQDSAHLDSASQLALEDKRNRAEISKMAEDLGLDIFKILKKGKIR